MSAELALVKPAESAPDLTAIEHVIVAGDLSKLTPDQRWDYYRGVCQSVGLNPFTKPFEYITLNSKLTLYALKGAADQLRARHHISIGKPNVEITDGLCIVTVTASDQTGRSDSELGIVPIENLRGEAKANAILKAITKAKRRVTLSMCGLGMLDETETETIPGARYQDADAMHGDAPALPAAPAPARSPEPADDVTRNKFEANWQKGVARAIAAGIEPTEKPGNDATKGDLNRAQRELMNEIVARETLNAELLTKIEAVKQAGGDVAEVNPAQCTSTEVHEMLAALNDMLNAASDDEAF